MPAANVLVEQILQRLPQTQCELCGYRGCRPYAEAIASGDRINKCPPGGASTIAALASLLKTDPMTLDNTHGHEKPRAVAFVREPECIGCAKCIEVCPVDAIVGAALLMHTVIAAECSGCGLCVAPCPVDCIEMRELQPPISSFDWQSPADQERSLQFRRRYESHEARRKLEKTTLQSRRRLPVEAERARKVAEVQAAIERVKAGKRTGAPNALVSKSTPS